MAEQTSSSGSASDFAPPLQQLTRQTSVNVTTTSAGSSLPAGAIVAYGGAVAPTGYKLCDGTAYDGTDTTYAALYAAIGTAYGGTGASNFQVPDLRGRVAVGLGSHTDVDALADNDGVAVANRTPKHNSTNSLTLPNHVHTITGDYQAGGSTAVDVAPSRGSAYSANTGNPTTNPAIGGSIGPGGTRPIDMPAYVVINYIISLG